MEVWVARVCVESERAVLMEVSAFFMAKYDTASQLKGCHKATVTLSHAVYCFFDAGRFLL
jgi:hypothetical protein